MSNSVTVQAASVYLSAWLYLSAWVILVCMSYICGQIGQTWPSGLINERLLEGLIMHWGADVRVFLATRVLRECSSTIGTGEHVDNVTYLRHEELVKVGKEQ